MGCVSSNLDCDSVLRTPRGEPVLRSTPLKRTFSSRISSASSSGFFSASNSTTTQRSISSHHKSTHTLASRSSSTLKAKPLAYNFQNANLKKGISLDTISVCDDFNEAGGTNKPQLNTSTGYYSGTVTPDDSLYSEGSTVPHLVRTLSTRSTKNVSDLQMEKFILEHTPQLMAKISTPLPHRRNVTHEVSDAQKSTGTVRQSRCYKTWSKQLTQAPMGPRHNVTKIPEAIAGQFCPRYFPAYSDVENEDTVSAAKRYKIDVNDASQVGMTFVNAKKEIMSTEL